jgi:type I restriction enzyme S subunit
MSDYRFKKLSSLCLRITDGSHYSPTGIDEGVPMLSVKDMRENGFDYADCKFISNETYLDLVRSDCKPLLNDVLIAKDGSYLKHVFVVKNEIAQAVLSSIGILRPNTSLVYPEYLKYYLQTESVKATVSRKYVSGSALPRIILKNFGEIQVVYRDLNNQQKIASVLSALDSKISLNNRINAELEAMAKTIYDYWFVQFDFPNERGKPYKSSGGKMVWNEELKREIPEGWEVKRLDECMRIIRGASPRPIDSFMSDFGAPWIKISDATAINHWFITQTKEFILEEGVRHSRELIPGTLILSNSASPGIPRIVQIRACVHDGWLIIDSYKMGLYNEFMLFYFENFRSKILNMGSGSIFKNLKTEYIKELKLVLPPSLILKDSQNLFDNIFGQILNNVKQNQQLATLRDWLLPMLMNGQVTVKDEAKA